LKAGILKSIITWSESGQKKKAQAKKVYWILESIHLVFAEGKNEEKLSVKGQELKNRTRL